MVVRPALAVSSLNEDDRGTSRNSQLLSAHVGRVEKLVGEMTERLGLEPNLRDALTTAAQVARPRKARAAVAAGLQCARRRALGQDGRTLPLELAGRLSARARIADRSRAPPQRSTNCHPTRASSRST